MSEIATKFVDWEVPPIESLKNTVAYRAKRDLLDGKKIHRKAKKDIVFALNTNSRFKDSIPLSGWKISFAAWLKDFFVRTPYGMEIVKAFDKPSAKHFITSQGFKITSITEEDGDGISQKKYRELQVVPKANGIISDETCPLCGGQHREARVPVWLFPKKSKRPLCRACAEKYAPEILQFISGYNELLKEKG